MVHLAEIVDPHAIIIILRIGKGVKGTRRGRTPRLQHHRLWTWRAPQAGDLGDSEEGGGGD